MVQDTILGTDLVRDALKAKVNNDIAEIFADFTALVAGYITGVTAETKTDDCTVTTSDFGKSIRMNSTEDKTFTLPSVGAGEDGKRIRLGKVNSGRVTIATADSDKIADSDAGGTIYNDVATEIFAYLDLEYVHATTTWNISGHGTWITTT